MYANGKVNIGDLKLWFHQEIQRINYQIIHNGEFKNELFIRISSINLFSCFIVFN